LKKRLPQVNIQAVMTTPLPKFTKNPVLAMSFMGTSPVANTIAFGGVATGSMKAQLAANVAGTISKAGGRSNALANSPMMGSNTFEVAVLLVTSVRKVTSKTTASTSRKGGRKSNTANCWPSHFERSVSWNPAARAKPPPKRKRICQGSAARSPNP